MLCNQLKMNLVAALGLLVVLVAVGCSDDDATASSCNFDTDCSLGTVCSVNKVCVRAACGFCSAEQVCLKTAENPEGTCSAPECSTNTDCAGKGGVCKAGLCTAIQCTTSVECGAGEVCTLANQCVASDGTCDSDPDCPTGEICRDSACVPGCATHEECADGKFCNADGICQTGCRDNTQCASNQTCNGEGRCICTPGGCGDGKFCNTESGMCDIVSSCEQVNCQSGQVCNPTTLSCQDACTADSCSPGQVCEASTGLCQTDNCPGEDPRQCDTNSARPIWDPVHCFCAECTSNADCTGAGEVCTAGGRCVACQTPCDAATPGTCTGSTPYCIDDCCAECVGAADCQAGQLCLGGACATPPSCTADPTACPTGTTCQNGTCAPNTGGGVCDPTNPTGCPTGTFCDPTTLTCSSAIGGGLGCGLCNPDCTCDGGLTCNGFLCEGCGVLVLGIPVGGPPCPNGGTCLPLEVIDPNLPNVCF